jgi:hypothetical protein
MPRVVRVAEAAPAWLAAVAAQAAAAATKVGKGAARAAAVAGARVEADHFARSAGQGEDLVGPTRRRPRSALPAVSPRVHQDETTAAWRHGVRRGVRRAAGDGGGEAVARELPGDLVVVQVGGNADIGAY